MVAGVDLTTLLQGLTVGLVLMAVKGVFGIRTELRLLNGRLLKLEIWTVGHEKADERTRGEVLRLHERLDQPPPRFR